MRKLGDQLCYYAAWIRMPRGGPTQLLGRVAAMELYCQLPRAVFHKSKESPQKGCGNDACHLPKRNILVTNQQEADPAMEVTASTCIGRLRSLYGSLGFNMITSIYKAPIDMLLGYIND